MVICNSHKIVKIVRVVPEISSRTDRHRQDVLITILCNLFRYRWDDGTCKTRTHQEMR